MKPLHQLERQLEEAREAGMACHARAEQWRTALEEINGFNTCPVIASIIKRHLHE